MKSGDWVKLEFLGRVKSTGEVFDLTSEDEARKHGLHDKDKKYGPVLVIIDAGMIMKGVEKALLGMKSGEKKSFEVPAKEAVGHRNPKLIKVIPSAKFAEKNINPFPGLVFQTENGFAKVLFVSGGRVRVDFNHPLAGKDLVYEVEITEVVKEAKKQVQELLDYYGVKGKLSLTGKKATVALEKDIGPLTEKLIGETLKKWCPGVDAIDFKKPGKPKGAGKPKPNASAGGGDATAAEKNAKT